MFAVEAEAPFAPTRPTALMCPPLAPMPPTLGEKYAWPGRPVGAGPSLVNERKGSDVTAQPGLGRATGRTLHGAPGGAGASWPGPGGLVFNFPKYSSGSPGFILAPLWPWCILTLYSGLGYS